MDTAVENLVDFLVNRSDEYEENHSRKNMRNEDGGMCAYAAFYDYNFIKKGKGEWITRGPDDEPDEYGEYYIAVNDYMESNWRDQWVIDGDLKKRLCDLNDNTELSFAEIGEIIKQEFGVANIGEVTSV